MTEKDELFNEWIKILRNDLSDSEVCLIKKFFVGGYNNNYDFVRMSTNEYSLYANAIIETSCQTAFRYGIFKSPFKNPVGIFENKQNVLTIPKSFVLFATTVNIVWDEIKSQNGDFYGEWSYATQTITMSKMNGVIPLSEDRVEETFYHERVHAILDAMHENELNKNEKFVDTFAKLLRQADKTAIYE